MSMALLCVSTLAPAQGAATYAQIEATAREALRWGDFAALQRMHDDYSRAEQLDSDGRSKLVAFRAGLVAGLGGRRDDTEAYYQEMEALTLQWTRDRPTSSLAHVLHVSALMGRAWWYRGNGLANTVPPQAWADFQRHVDRAARHLADHAATVFVSGAGYTEALDVGRAAGWPVDRLLAIAKEGMTRHPHDDTIARSALTSVLPKWHGNAQLVDRFIREAAAQRTDGRGDEVYAWLYSSAADGQFEHRLFVDSGAQWGRLKRGFDDIVQRHPTPGNLNRFAYLACLAEDKPTTVDLLARVGAQPDLERWGANARRTYETCRRWAAQL